MQRTLASALCALLIEWVSHSSVKLKDEAVCVSGGMGTQRLLRFCLKKAAGGVIIKLNPFVAPASYAI